MSDRPESLLQFGGGNFLRAFADLFLHEANAAGDEEGRAVVVTSTDSERARWINTQQGRYHVLLRGLRDGATVDEAITVDRALSRALPAADAWSEVLAVATSPALRWIVSNTTEAGLALDPADDDTTRDAALGVGTPAAPGSFPAKLLALLVHRLEAGLPAPSVLPCELVEDNGPVLLDLLREQARVWSLPAEVVDAVVQTPLASTLVDRIVSGRPDEHPLLAQDRLLTVAEPFASWVVEERPGLDLFAHPAITRTDDVAEYALRKVRLLNGAHTALVCRALPLGLETVGAAVAHDDVRPWLRELLFEEILPVVRDRIVDGEGFAEATLERFANPYLAHRLHDIALHHETKVSTRLLPTYHEHIELTGTPPRRLGEILAPFL